MTRNSVQPRYRIFVKDYGFLSFAKNMGTNIGKNISKNLNGKYIPGMLPRVAQVYDHTRQKPLDHAKQSATEAFKTASKRGIQKTAEATGDFVILSVISDAHLRSCQCE